jgi:hypothetical protein
MPDRKREEDQFELDDLEIQIKDRFGKVTPDPEFVHKLRRNLANAPEMMLEEPRRISNLLLVMGIITGGLLVVTIFARLVYELLAWFGVLGKPHNQ